MGLFIKPLDSDLVLQLTWVLLKVILPIAMEFLTSLFCVFCVPVLGIELNVLCTLASTEHSTTELQPQI